MFPARVPDGTEHRTVRELRAAGRRLEGYASVFNAKASIGPEGAAFHEFIRPGAFRSSLAGARDILALVDHDPSRLLARTRSSTLRLSEDTRGLHFEIDLPDTQLGRDMAALAERGDLGGMSIGFQSRAEDWPDRDTRELVTVDLIEVSVVQAFPAYADTTVALRSRPRPGSERFWSPRARQRYLDTL